jgi:hypothetical protein
MFVMYMSAFTEKAFARFSAVAIDVSSHGAYDFTSLTHADRSRLLGAITRAAGWPRLWS